MTIDIKPFNLKFYYPDRDNIAEDGFTREIIVQNNLSP